MSKKKGITHAAGDGFDRIEWLDAEGRKHALRADNPVSAKLVLPSGRTRRPGKGEGQVTFQGNYWCAGSGAHVFHESMLEFTSMMLIDHLNDIVSLYAQPMLLTFADGDFHYPDFLAIDAEGTRILVDAHPKSRTTPEDERKFELTRQMCERLGWKYILIDEMSRVVRWNLEFLARYQHPRFAPDTETREWLLALSSTCDTLGELYAACRTDKPGEHVPALIHLFWRRHIGIDIAEPITFDSPICLP